MISSIFYPAKQSNENANKQQSQVDNFHLFQIIFFKLIVVFMSIFLPLFFKGDTSCFIITLTIAFQFWMNKNLARTFIKAYWYVDTTTQKDRWVYQAQINSTDTFEGLFWYSSIIYFGLLGICFIYYVSRNQLSLSCSLLIGLICAYLNFFAYSKIIKARNNGILQKLHSQVDKSLTNIQNRKTTVQLPLITVRSQLKQIEQQEQYFQYA